MTQFDLPPLMPVDCPACGRRITADQFARSVLRQDVRPGGRVVSSGPLHAECAKPDPDDVILWPDDTWCYRHELAEFSHKSDDYEVLAVGTPAYEVHQGREVPACSGCGGAGHIEVPVGRGPDVYLEPACCPDCGGTGAQSYSHGKESVPNELRGDEAVPR